MDVRPYIFPSLLQGHVGPLQAAVSCKTTQVMMLWVGGVHLLGTVITLGVKGIYYKHHSVLNVY